MSESQSQEQQQPIPIDLKYNKPLVCLIAHRDVLRRKGETRWRSAERRVLYMSNHLLKEELAQARCIDSEYKRALALGQCMATLVIHSLLPINDWIKLVINHALRFGSAITKLLKPNDRTSTVDPGAVKNLLFQVRIVRDVIRETVRVNNSVWSILRFAKESLDTHADDKETQSHLKVGERMQEFKMLVLQREIQL